MPIKKRSEIRNLHISLLPDVGPMHSLANKETSNLIAQASASKLNNNYLYNSQITGNYNSYGAGQTETGETTDGQL